MPGTNPTPGAWDALVLELPSELDRIQHAVDTVLARCSGCFSDPKRLRLNLRVGLTEALANAMLYGNRRDPDKRVRVEVRLLGSRITACVTDEGPGFDPDTIPDPRYPENLQKPCGRGLFLMRQLLDEVRFNERGNSVTLVLDSRPRRMSGGAMA